MITVKNTLVKTGRMLLRTANKGKVYGPQQIADALYQAILGRAADEAGMRGLVDYLECGGSLNNAISGMLASGESTIKRMQEIMPAHSLPNLRGMFPKYFSIEYTEGGESIVFHAQSDDDFNLLEKWIHQYRYYDVPGVWGAKIDTDKKVTAALAQGLGAKKCLEIGCFTGAVLSLLKDAGVQVVGLDASHLAFVLAYPKIREHLIFGDLLSVDFKNKFDVIVAMDILEHLNPVKFDEYIEKIESSVTEDGYVYINSPMFGTDDVFGTVFPSYLSEWKSVGDTRYWNDMDCDELGWPKHGHLIWASPAWWEQAFRAKGLVRDRDIESAIHQKLEKFFEVAPSRKCFFVLKKPNNQLRSQDIIGDIVERLSRVEELNQ